MSLIPSPQPVRPGDLITAKWVNDLISALVGLESRVAQLEQEAADAGRLVITDILPSTTIRSGEELTVLGRNFEIPVALNTVTVGNQPIVTFNEATSERLAFTVPFIANTRTAVDLTIRNSHGEDSAGLTVDPPAPRVPQGELFIQEDFGNLGKILADHQYTYFFMVTSATDINEAYRFQITFAHADGSPAPEWQTNAAIVGADGSVLTQPVQLIAYVERRIGVRLRVPAGLADGTSVTMTVTARSQNSPNDPLLNRTNTTEIKINEEQQTSSDKISFTAPLVFGTGGRVAADGAIEAPIEGNRVRVQIEAGFSVGGTYDITASFEPDATGIWTIVDCIPQSTTEDNNGSQQINTRIQSLAADPALARFLVVRVESRLTNTNESIISWTRMPVRGYHPN